MNKIIVEAGESLNIYDATIQDEPVVVFHITGFNFQLNQMVSASYSCSYEDARSIGQKLISYSEQKQTSDK